jgi:TonB family protein
MGADPASGILAMVAYSVAGHILAVTAFMLAPRVIPRRPPPPLVLTGQIVTLPPAWSRPPTGGAPAAAPEPAPAPSPRPAAPEPPKPEPEPKPKPPRARKPEVIPPEPGKPRADTPEPPRGPDRGPAKAEPEPGPAAPIPEGVGLAAGGAETGTGIPSISSSVFPYEWYRTTMVNLIRSRWSRPVTPGLTQPLRCSIAFVIGKNGAVGDVAVAASSGFGPLDQSAHRAVLESSPLPPLPYQYTAESVRAELIFELTPD